MSNFQLNANRMYRSKKQQQRIASVYPINFGLGKTALELLFIYLNANVLKNCGANRMLFDCNDAIILVCMNSNDEDKAVSRLLVSITDTPKPDNTVFVSKHGPVFCVIHPHWHHRMMDKIKDLPLVNDQNTGSWPGYTRSQDMIRYAVDLVCMRVLSLLTERK